jgi:lipoate-protein ligase A
MIESPMAGPARISRWQLLDTGARAGDWNMALDRVLLDAVTADAPVLRFYSWSAPTLSFGRMQRVPAELLRRCAELGVMAVRRPTGGKAILHRHEVTFSIIAPSAGLGSVIESYRTFARAIAAGLRTLGAEAQLCEAQGAPHRRELLCFAAPAQCDLEVGGMKLLGSAQARRGGALLQQNSLPLRLSDDVKERLCGAEAAAEEARIATDLTSALGCEPLFNEVRDAIVAGFERELGATFELREVTARESSAAERLRSGSVLGRQRF